MFGELPMFGQGKYKIDNKGRMFLPPFSSPEQGDSIVIARSQENGEVFTLENLHNLSKRVEALKKSIANGDKVEELENELKRLFASCYSTISVDSQRRILIPSKIRENYNFKDSVIVLGAYDHLYLFNSELSYTKFRSQFKY